MTLQFIPARGRKLAPVRRGGTAQILQFIPARGRKRPLPGVIIRRVLLQFIPARGRKWANAKVVTTGAKIVIYPRKGTETVFCPPVLWWCYHCNLSPQGDENLNPLERVVVRLRLQFIPTRGRKCTNCTILFKVHSIATYPRKGTETQPLFSFCLT